MGEKQQLKSKGKAPKPAKNGLRPHEVRAQVVGTKAVPGQPQTPGERKRA